MTELSASRMQIQLRSGAVWEEVRVVPWSRSRRDVLAYLYDPSTGTILNLMKLVKHSLNI